MQVPIAWLKDFVAIDCSAEEVATRLTMGGLEVEGIEDSPIGPVLDVYVTPNRGDCASVLGIAREVAALLDLPLTIRADPTAAGEEANALTSVTIEDSEGCPRYAARLVKEVRVAPSPLWMQERLEAAGQRPINNVVDVTNYVMLELGQPMHAFDFVKLREQRIVVRRAKPGERIRTLDGVDRPLLPSMLVIADAVAPVAVAGVMGGADSEVTEGTGTILLESAHFNPLSVRRTARALELRTEASYRFERTVDPSGVVRALDRACELLAALGAASPSPGTVDAYPRRATPKRISFRTDRATRLLGMAITPEIAASCLNRLGFQVSRAESSLEPLSVIVPLYRPDIEQEEDLVEEVGRVYGYENIPETLPSGITVSGGDSEEGRFLSAVRRILVGEGLQEVVTHSLTAASPPGLESAERVPVRNALSSEIGLLRASLLPGLLDAARHNASRSNRRAAIFEIGRAWRAAGKADGAQPVERIQAAGLIACTPGACEPGFRASETEPDFSLARGVVSQLLERLGFRSVEFDPPEKAAGPHDASGSVNKPIGNAGLEALHPGIRAKISAESVAVGVVGALHPEICAGYNLKEPVFCFEVDLTELLSLPHETHPTYHPLSRYPAVTRDVAPRVADSVPYGAVARAARRAAGELLEDASLSDLYSGPPLPHGTKSFTLTLTFRAQDRTLEESEVESAMTRIREQLSSECGATFATGAPAEAQSESHHNFREGVPS